MLYHGQVVHHAGMYVRVSVRACESIGGEPTFTSFVRYGKLVVSLFFFIPEFRNKGLGKFFSCDFFLRIYTIKIKIKKESGHFECKIL